MKKCTGCKQEKPPEEYWTNKLGRGGKQPKCKLCLLEQQRNRRRQHGDVPRLKYLYKTTPEYIKGLLEKQDYKCAVCSKELKEDNHTVIDHCHNTKRIRGMLCRKCNIGLGMFGDDPEIVHKALEYLRCW